MKKNITIDYSNGFPCLGNGIDFTEECFGLQFNAALIQQTSELIWKPNSTLPNTTAQSLPAPFNVLSDLGKAMTVNLNGNTGLIGKKQLLNEVKLLDHSLMDNFITHVTNHIENPTRESAQLIADIRCWTSWIANGIKIEPIFNGELRGCSLIPCPLS